MKRVMVAGVIALACGSTPQAQAPQVGEAVTEGEWRRRRELWALHEQYAVFAELEADMVLRLRRYDSLEGSVEPEELAEARAKIQAILDGARAKLREIDDQRRALAR